MYLELVQLRLPVRCVGGGWGLLGRALETRWTGMCANADISVLRGRGVVREGVLGVVHGLHVMLQRADIPVRKEGEAGRRRWRVRAVAGVMRLLPAPGRVVWQFMGNARWLLVGVHRIWSALDRATSLCGVRREGIKGGLVAFESKTCLGVVQK